MELSEIVIYFLENVEKMSSERLERMIYLSDWHFSINHKKQITNINWRLSSRSLTSNDFLEFIEKESDLFDFYYENKMKIIRLVRSQKNYKILDKEIKKTLDHVVDISNKMEEWEIIRLVNSTYPVISSSPYSSSLNLVNKAKEYICYNISI